MHKVHFTTLHIVYIINCSTYSKLSLKLESLKFLLYLVDVFCKSTILLLPTVLHLSWHVPSDYDEVIILNIIRSPSWQSNNNCLPFQSIRVPKMTWHILMSHLDLQNVVSLKLIVVAKLISWHKCWKCNNCLTSYYTIYKR